MPYGLGRTLPREFQGRRNLPLIDQDCGGIRTKGLHLGMIAFDRDSGVVVFARGKAPGPSPAAVAEVWPAAFAAHLKRLGLAADALEFRYDADRAVVQITGPVTDQDQRERIVLCCGNVSGVGGVEDHMAVAMPSEVSRWRFVQPGDTFESIARDAYRDAGRGDDLRAANQPLVRGVAAPSPGWLLRIPAVEERRSWAMR